MTPRGAVAEPDALGDDEYRDPGEDADEQRAAGQATKRGPVGQGRDETRHAERDEQVRQHVGQEVAPEAPRISVSTPTSPKPRAASTTANTRATCAARAAFASANAQDAREPMVDGRHRAHHAR